MGSRYVRVTLWLDHLFAFIDCNDQQADGPPSKVLNVEPVHEKWQAFGWDTQPHRRQRYARRS